MRITKLTREMAAAATLASAIAFIGAPPGCHAAAGPRQDAQKSYELDLPATKQWTDTNITLRAGEKLSITATGEITYPPADSKKSQTPQTFGPDGLSRGWKDLLHEYAVPNGGRGALIGRLGSDDAAQPFLLGASNDYTAPVAGRLFLGMNERLKDAGAATGSFHVKIEVLNPGSSDAAAAVVGGPVDSPIPAVTADLLGKIPR